MSEGHFPLQKALFSFVLRWKLKKLIQIEWTSKALGKLLAITDISAKSSGAAAHNHTYWKPDWHWAVISVTSLTDVCLSPDCLELECAWKHVRIFSLLGWVTEKFYPEQGNCSEGAERTGCTAQLGICVHCAASSTARVLKLWKYVLQ